MVLAEPPEELSGLNSRLSSSEKGDSEAGDTLRCCGGCGRRTRRGMRLRDTSFSGCAFCSSSGKKEGRKEAPRPSAPAPARRPSDAPSAARGGGQEAASAPRGGAGSARLGSAARGRRAAGEGRGSGGCGVGRPKAAAAAADPAGPARAPARPLRHSGSRLTPGATASQPRSNLGSAASLQTRSRSPAPPSARNSPTSQPPVPQPAFPLQPTGLAASRRPCSAAAFSRPALTLPLSRMGPMVLSHGAVRHGHLAWARGTRSAAAAAAAAALRVAEPGPAPPLPAPTRGAAARPPWGAERGDRQRLWPAPALPRASGARHGRFEQPLKPAGIVARWTRAAPALTLFAVLWISRWGAGAET